MLLTTLTWSSTDPQWQERSVDTARGQRDCAAASANAVGFITYHNLDHHDRATGAEACLKGWIQPDEETYFTPPGWKPGMDLGHLVACMFGGDNAKPENFVPLHPNANRIEMRKVEDEVARRIRGRGNRVSRGNACLSAAHRSEHVRPCSGAHLRLQCQWRDRPKMVLNK
ncbi:DNA/RNA non-specific endonuclease [Lentzea waywayandensis]|uniref:DNA/RNA non-specific endonuclease n=1 Tax=Lentzea waywayandensis TaxID=84724 RepID=UPI001FED0337|nr:DNA/RNA non-specific endonuclease [Lentzea waywayandensis]